MVVVQGGQPGDPAQLGRHGGADKIPGWPLVKTIRQGYQGFRPPFFFLFFPPVRESLYGGWNQVRWQLASQGRMVKKPFPEERLEGRVA